MDLLPTEEQQQIVDTARSFLDDKFALADALQLKAGESRVDANQIKEIAALGWLGIGLSETLGGVGYGLCEEVLLFTELGRTLMPPSILGSVLGARIAAAAGDENLVTALLSGEQKVAIAIARDPANFEHSTVIDGELLAFEADDAQWILLATPQNNFFVARSELSEFTPQTCIDPGLHAASCSAEQVTPSIAVSNRVERLFERGAVLCSALMLGIAEATLERSVAYAKEREQYGKPIGSFQAIKHYCADMAIHCESVRAMLYYASVSFEEGQDSAALDVHTLKIIADKAAQHNADTAVQIHGGMGYTQEMDIHLFVKRAQVLTSLFGSQRLHMRELLTQPRPV